MESTSAVFAFEVGAVAFGADGFCGAGEGWVAGFWALAHKELSPKQSVKTAAMSFLMANNLTPMQPNSQTPGSTAAVPFQCSQMSALIGASSSGCCRCHHCR